MIWEVPLFSETSIYSYVPLPETQVRRFSNASDAVPWPRGEWPTMIRCNKLTWHQLKLGYMFICSCLGVVWCWVVVEVKWYEHAKMKLPIFRQNQLLYSLHVFGSVFFALMFIAVTSCYFFIFDSWFTPPKFNIAPEKRWLEDYWLLSSTFLSWCVGTSVPFPLQVPAVIPEAEEAKFDPLAPWFRYWWNRWCCYPPGN